MLWLLPYRLVGEKDAQAFGVLDGIVGCRKLFSDMVNEVLGSCEARRRCWALAVV